MSPYALLKCHKLYPGIPGCINFGSLACTRAVIRNFWTPIDYMEVDGCGKLRFWSWGALAIRQLNHIGCVVFMDDLSYKEKERLSLLSHAINQQKDIIKEVKLRECISKSSKSHELTVRDKPPGRWDILHDFELTLTAYYFFKNQSTRTTVSS